MVLDQLRSAFAGKPVDVGPTTEQSVDASMKDTPTPPGPSIAQTAIEIQDKLLEPSDTKVSKHHARLNRAQRIAVLTVREERYYALTSQLIQTFDEMGLTSLADRFDATSQIELNLTASRDGTGLKQFNTTTVDQKKTVTEIKTGRQPTW